MRLIIDVVYEDRAFKPLKPLESQGIFIPEGEKLTIEIKTVLNERRVNTTPEIEILDVKELEPAKPYPEMEDYGETRRFKVLARINGESRSFTVYELLEENKEHLCYVLNGYSYRVENSKNKDFYYDQDGVYFSGWGISWKRESKHKFDEGEVEEIAKITGFRYVYDDVKRRYKIYIHPEREPLVVNSKPNKSMLKRLILGWLACLELI